TISRRICCGCTVPFSWATAIKPTNNTAKVRLPHLNFVICILLRHINIGGPEVITLTTNLKAALFALALTTSCQNQATGVRRLTFTSHRALQYLRPGRYRSPY